jgi:ribosomal subunit interface protein
MNYQITSDNIEVSESMRELAKVKLSKLENRFKDVPEGSKSARIVMNTEPVERFGVKIELNIDGTMFFIDQKGFTLEACLITAVEELERQVEKSKFGTAGWEDKRESKRFPTDTDDPEAL